MASEAAFGIVRGTSKQRTIKGRERGGDVTWIGCPCHIERWWGTRYVTSHSPRSRAAPTFAFLPLSLPRCPSLSFLSCCFDPQCLNPHPCLAVGMDAVLDGCLAGTAGTRTKRTALKSSSSSTSSPFSAVVGLSKGKRLIKAPKEKGAERSGLF